MDYEYFLKMQLKKFDYILEELKMRELYKDIENDDLKILFSIMHQEFNSLLEFMNKKCNSNYHYNADESRELIKYITLYEDMDKHLEGTNLHFYLEKNYVERLKECKSFLVESGGSAIPEDYKKFAITKYKPIFFTENTVKIKDLVSEKYIKIKMIGEGSYATVYKYKDDFYNKDYVIKRAKKELDEKEINRFKKEYCIMKKLKSPYIIEVYKYDENKNEYYMEHVDQSIGDFIKKNNTKLPDSKRINLVNQVFKAFEYIHSKELFHRDISLDNVLLKHYEDVTIVKISDFGLVKDKSSTLTSLDSEIKGSLNDSNLHLVGFGNYSIKYETYALTRLIYFIMTGRTDISKRDNIYLKYKDFIDNGLNSNIEKRFSTISEMREIFAKTYKN